MEASGATQHHSKTPSYTRESKSCRHHQPVDWLIPTTCSNTTTLLLAVSYITLAHTRNITGIHITFTHTHTYMHTSTHIESRDTRGILLNILLGSAELVPHDSSVLLPGDSPAAPRRYSHVSPVVGNSVELVPKTTTTTRSSNHLRFNPPT